MLDEKTKRNTQRFTRRLLELMREAGISTEREFAERLGVHPNTWTRYKKGATAPDLAIITKVSDEFGVSIIWLIGDHEDSLVVERAKSADGFTAPMPARVLTIDVDLVERLRAMAADAYREFGHKLPPNQAMREAANLYNEILDKVSDMTDAAEIESIMPNLRYNLTKRLESTAAEPGTGKRSAS